MYKQEEINILTAQQFKHPLSELEQAITQGELVQLQEAIKSMYVDDTIKEYIVSIIDATRHHPDIYLGSSPRGGLALYKTSQALAALQGRDYVIPDDIKTLAEPTLAHRLIISPAARMKNVEADDVIAEILNSVPVPGTPVRAG